VARIPEGSRCRARSLGRGDRGSERRRAVPGAPTDVGRISRGSALEAPPRGEAQGEEARGWNRPVHDRDCGRGDA